MHYDKHDIMQLPDQSNETVRAAKLVHDLPQPIMADSVKSLGQIHKDGVEADILVLTLLSELSCSKYHINHSVALMEATLTL